MLKEKRKNEEYVLDIKERIDRIKEALYEVGYDKFLGNRVLKDSVMFNITIIGEAVSKVDRDFLLKYNKDKIYWREIKDARNFIIHNYPNIRDGKIYRMATENILVLEKFIDIMIDDFIATLEEKGI